MTRWRRRRRRLPCHHGLSLRVILLLEDMVPTGDPDDQANLPG
ncbi:unnamed protein product [Ectocarpus sp. 13 AM-2016]